MHVTLQQAADLLGKSARQVRYLVKKGELKAEKVEGRWMIARDALPLPPAQAKAAGRRDDRLHRVVDESLAAAGAERKAPSVHQLRAYRLLLPLYREVVAAGEAGDPVGVSLAAALRALALGCHRFYKEDKASAYREARDAVSEAVFHLSVAGDEASEQRAGTLETEVMPAISGLLSRFDRRRRVA